MVYSYLVSFLDTETPPGIKICPQKRKFALHMIIIMFVDEMVTVEKGLERHEGRLNIKMLSYQYRDPRVKDKTVLRPSYL